MFKLIRIAVKDVYRKAFKTIIFSLIISMSIGALVLALAMNTSINNTIDINITNSLSSREIYIAVNNSLGKTNEAYLNFLKDIPYMENVYKYMPNVMAKIDDESPLNSGGYMLSFISPKYFPKIISGQNFGESDKNTAIIPQKIYIQNGGSGKILNGSTLIGKTISLVYSNNDGSSKYSYACKVVGIYGNQLGTSANTIYIPLNDMYKICTNSGQYDSNKNLSFMGIVDKQKFVDATIKQLSSINNMTAKLYTTSSDTNEVGTYKLISKVSSYMVYSILVFILLLLYFCVTNIAIDNEKQIALYKAIGYNNRHIFYIVFSEAIIISLIGYFVGILISVFALKFILNPIIYIHTDLSLSISISLVHCIIPLISIITIAFLVSLFSYIKVKNIYPGILLKQD